MRRPWKDCCVGSGSPAYMFPHVPTRLEPTSGAYLQKDMRGQSLSFGKIILVVDRGDLSCLLVLWDLRDMEGKYVARGHIAVRSSAVPYRKVTVITESPWECAPETHQLPALSPLTCCDPSHTADKAPSCFYPYCFSMKIHLGSSKHSQPPPPSE